MATLKGVFWIPELDRGSQTDKEIKEIRVYRVYFDSTDLGTALESLLADDGTTAVPQFEDGISVGGVDLFVNNLDCTRGSDPTYFDVTVTFSSLGNDPNKSGKWNVDISSDGVGYSETVTRYTDGTLICNSAGDIYDPAPIKTRYDEKFTVSYMTNSLDADGLAAARGKINSDTVTMTVKGISRTFAPNTLKLVNAPWKITYSSGTFTAYSMTIEMEYRADTWALKVVDKGLRIRTGGKLFPATDDAGANATAPVYLDGNGGKLNTATPPVMAVFFPAVAKFVDFTTAFSAFLSGI